MIKSISRIACLCAITLLPASAMAQFNGLKVNPYVFPDIPTSTLTITNSNSVPGSVTINDTFSAPAAGVNRHDVMLSQDNGVSAYNFSIDTPFTIYTSLTLTVGNTTPRKESGLRINSPVTGDALFIVNSDAGEIVAFGGPFYNFRDPGGFNEPAYVPGQTILMGMTYRPGSPTTTGGTPATIEYFIDRGSGIKSSGPLAFSNLEGGAVNFQVGMYAQGGPGSNTSDFFNAQFANVNAFIPEPASAGIAIMGLMALSSIRRRRA